MPKKYIPKPKKYTKEDLDKAANLVRSEGFSIRTAAKAFGIDKSKLSRYINKKNLTKQGRKTSLSLDVEQDLASKLVTMAQWGFALTKLEVKNAVQTYVQENNLTTAFKDGRPGDDWFKNFCRRNRLSLKKMEQLEKSRRLATSDPFIIYSFYDKVEKCINDLNLTSSQIWNVDETFLPMDPSRIKGIAAKGQKVHRNIEGSGKENVTVMGCISASGCSLPPLIIFQGQNLWSSWKGTNDLENTMYGVSEKGWMTTNIFNEWFAKFCTIIKERPLLVLLDGHLTHLDKHTIELAIKENVTLLKLPAHSTDLLQPLDRGCFGPLKLKWNEKLIDWQRQNQRKLTKSEFSDLLCSIWEEGIPKKNIVSSFASTGIFPFSREKYPITRLDPTKLERYEALRQVNKDPLDIKCDELEINGVQEESVEEPGDLEVPENSNLICSNNEIPTPPQGTNCSFENILLKKLNKTTSTVQKRRKILSGSQILTSQEYAKLIENIEKEKGKMKNKTRKSRKTVQKKKLSSSSESEPEIEVEYEDESDVENMTLADVIRNETDGGKTDEDDANELENMPIGKPVGAKYTEDRSRITAGDFILVKFKTKNNEVHYMATVKELLPNDEFRVSYLRRKGNRFVYPAVPEISNVVKEDIVLKLPPQASLAGTSRAADVFSFSIDFDRYLVR